MLSHFLGNRSPALVALLTQLLDLALTSFLIITLPVLTDYLLAGIDDFSRELYAAILPDKIQNSTATSLERVIEECPYTIECAYSDNGTEYNENPDHAFVALCKTNSIGQKFTCVRRPQTHGKAEHVIKTIFEMWH